MKVIFVGIHNKEDLMPLDIISKSGKVITAIEKELGIKGKRTNLYNLDRMPEGNEIDQEPVNWWYRYNIQSGDIVVLLGRFVHDNFHYKDGYTYIKLPHPASSFFHGTTTKDEYIKKAVDKIKNHYS